MKKYTLLTLLLVVTCISVLYWQYDYRPFYPVKHVGDEYVVDNIEKQSHPFNENLIKVLDYYNVDFKLCNGVVHVKNQLYANKALMYNYTRKAKDEMWFNDHHFAYYKNNSK